MVNYIDYKNAQFHQSDSILLFDEDAFESMKKVGRLTAECLDLVGNLIKAGTTTKEIDNFVFDFGCAHGAIPATLNYRGYKYSCCTSINHVVCHGMPNNKPLNEGEIINVDVTYILDGWHGDSSRTYAVGRVRRAAQRLMEVTHESLMRAIEAVKPGNTTGDIGYAIQNYAEKERCSVVRDFCGHGIGQRFHDLPHILHYGQPGEGIELKEGMIFTIEPMINLGKPAVKILADGWTAVTRDRSLTAQYEHTIGVTKEGCEIFTLSPKNIFFKQPQTLK